MTVLKAENLGVRFGGLQAVNNFSFTTREGEILSIIGPNGAGKTTVFNALTGFIKPTSGKVLLDGHDITGHPPFAVVKRGLARTFQKRSFFPTLTVMENMLLGCHLENDVSLREAMQGTPAKAREEKNKRYVRDLLDFVGLRGREQRAACNLPYGEQRLLGIAIALACQPKIVLLDEPCAGSNPSEAQNIVRLIGEIRQSGVSVILVEHHMKVVMSISDRIIVLSSGEKIAEGNAEAIQQNPQVIEAYLGRRAKNGPAA